MNIGFVVSCMGWSMMSMLVGSWGDGVGRYMTISEDLSSDGDWELMCFISVSTSSRNGGSTSITVWSSAGSNGGY